MVHLIGRRLAASGEQERQQSAEYLQSSPFSPTTLMLHIWNRYGAVAVPIGTMVLRQLSALTIVMIWLSGCGPVERGAADRFIATGEMIALSGGDAGAPNACFTCHGLDGHGNGEGTPRLAGLDRGYMTAQLAAYASGRRQHPEMAAIAAKLTAVQQDAVSAYYAAKPFVPSSATSSQSAEQTTNLYHSGDPARGLPSCASCHGTSGEGVGPANPPLGAQPAAYLAEQLEQWRSAKRRNDPQNVMLRISQALSHQESEALAAYAAALPGGLAHPESPAASRAAHRGDPKNDASAPPQHAAE